MGEPRGPTDPLGGDVADFDIESLLSEPIVSAASKREQSALVAPAAVTVLTRSDIEASTAESLGDLLRMVPGAHVFQGHANDFNIGLRGVNRIGNNRVLVLLDGRNVAESSLAFIPWGALPVALGEIERIEVVRGPSSIVYGADALSGVINVVTRSPLEDDGVRAEITTGQYFRPNSPRVERAGGHRRVNGGHGYVAWGSRSDDARTGVRLTLGFQRLPEWSTLEDRDRFRQGPASYHTALRFSTRPTETTEFFAALTQTASEFLTGFQSQREPHYFDLSEQAIVARFVARDVMSLPIDLTTSCDYRHLLMNAGDEIDLPGFGFRTTEDSAHALIQTDVHLFDDRNVLTLGFEATGRRMNDFFNTHPRRQYFAVMAQNDLGLTADRSLSLNAGLRLEKVTTSDSGNLRSVFHNLTPRIALTWRPRERHAVRLSAGTAYRTPSPWEAFVPIRSQISPPPNPPIRFVLNNPSLIPEKVESIEIGYRGQLFGALRLDASLIAQRLSSLIGLALEPRLPVQMSNMGSIDQVGVEIGTDIALSAHLTAGFQYAAWFARDMATGRRNLDWPSHIVATTVEARLPARLRLGLESYAVVGMAPARVRVMDFGVAVDTRAFADQLHVSLRLGYLLPDDVGEVFLSARNIAAYWRRYSDLRQYRAEGNDAIGAATLIGVRLN